MLKDKKTPEKFDEYECALQLREVLEKSNLSPIMTMVMYEFLADVKNNAIPKDTSIYEYIENLFAERIKANVIDNKPNTSIIAKAKAYLILLIELACHAELLTGLFVELQPLKQKGECKFNVQLKQKDFGISASGINFLKKVEDIRDNHLTGDNLIARLSAITLEEADKIILRYKADDPFDEGDVIVVGGVQA